MPKNIVYLFRQVLYVANFLLTPRKVSRIDPKMEPIVGMVAIFGKLFKLIYSPDAKFFHQTLKFYRVNAGLL